MKLNNSSFRVLYILAFGYGFLCLLLGKILMCVVLIGLGIPILWFLALDFFVSPAIAALVGFQSRWSVKSAIAFGAPLVVLCTVVFSTANVTYTSENRYSPNNILDTLAGMPFIIPLPAALRVSSINVGAILGSRLLYWFLVYLAFFGLGLLSPSIKPLKPTKDSE